MSLGTIPTSASRSGVALEADAGAQQFVDRILDALEAAAHGRQSGPGPAVTRTRLRWATRLNVLAGSRPASASNYQTFPQVDAILDIGHGQYVVLLADDTAAVITDRPHTRTCSCDAFERLTVVGTLDRARACGGHTVAVTESERMIEGVRRKAHCQHANAVFASIVTEHEDSHRLLGPCPACGSARHHLVHTRDSDGTSHTRRVCATCQRPLAIIS